MTTTPAWFELLVDAVAVAYWTGHRDGEMVLTAALDQAELRRVADRPTIEQRRAAQAAGQQSIPAGADWPDVMTRWPGESVEHYQWRCRPAKVGAA